MTRKEIIEKLKTNTEGFAFLAPEVQKFVRELLQNKNTFLSRLTWMKDGERRETDICWHKCTTNANIYADDIYRLSPDYSEPEEPKVVKCEVKANVSNLEFNYNSRWYLIYTAISFPTFSHFE
jgi:hypothetical protein